MHRLGERARHRIPLVRAQNAPVSHVLLLLKLQPGQAVVFVGRPAGVRLKAVRVRDLHPAQLLQPLLRAHPHLGPAIERPGAGLALHIKAHVWLKIKQPRERLRRGSDEPARDDATAAEVHDDHLVQDGLNDLAKIGREPELKWPEHGSLHLLVLRFRALGVRSGGIQHDTHAMCPFSIGTVAISAVQ
jgi:hypothetical protein